MLSPTVSDLTSSRSTAQALSTLRRRWYQATSRTRTVVVALGVIGLLVWHFWLTTNPLTSGDWNWQSAGALGPYFPWPSVWNDTLGLTGENRFIDVFRFPVFALSGAMSMVGLSFSVIEKVIYYLPCAILLPVAGWLLAREVLGATRWALLAPVLMLGNAYFVIEMNSELPLVLAEAIGCLALVAFIRCMRTVSFRWGLVTGLLIGVAAAVDIRPAYLTVLLIVGYLLIITVAQPGWRLFRGRLFCAAAAGATFLGTQAFWIVPLLTYHGRTQLPIPRAPNFNVITLEHGIAGVSAFWTGGNPANLVEAPLDPLFMIIPIVAMVPLLRRRLSPELVWLALAAIAGAFLAKTNTPPFGGLYNFLFQNFPGFNLFREGSKFFYPVCVGYAVLIPAALQEIFARSRPSRPRLLKVTRATAGVALAVMLVTVGSVVLVLERGQLGSTTTPVAQPKAFGQLSSLLAADHSRGAVLWFGSPTYQTPDLREHRYLITSATHPEANLTGNGTSAEINRRDYFQYFCAATNQPFCYLTPTLFPYLASMAGASYVVSPYGGPMGVLPSGITQGWLEGQLRALYGTPKVLGTQGKQLLVWHLPAPQPSVANYPAVAEVDSGPWSLAEVLPALKAMGLPAAYTQTPDSIDFPAVPAHLPDSIAVTPNIDGGYNSPSGGTVGLLADTTAATITITNDGVSRTLPRLATSTRLAGWAVYGPIALPSVYVPITAGATTLGPAVSWSGLTTAAFGAHAQAAGPSKTSANGERVKATAVAAPQPWTELRRFYDKGWRLSGQKPIGVGEGLFNLYYTAHPKPQADGFKFAFSAIEFEHIGQALALISVIVILLLLVRPIRRRGPRPAVPERAVLMEGRLAPRIGMVAMVFMVLTGLSTVSDWFGLPSKAPWTSVLPDPYSGDILFGAIALGLFGLSLLTRMAEHVILASRVRAPETVHPTRWRRTAAAAAAASLMAGCGVVGGPSAAQALVNATSAGAPSRDISVATLDQAEVVTQASHAHRCVTDYTIALRAYPDLVTAYEGRADCYQSDGYDSAAAVHDLQKALSLDPDDPNVLLKLAAAERGAGNNKAAAADYRKAALSPAADSAAVLATVDGLIAMQDYPLAEANVQTGLDRFPGDALTVLGISDLAIANDNDVQGAAQLARASVLAQSNSTEVPFVTSRQCGYDVLTQAYQAALTVCRQAATTGQDGSGAFDNLSVADLGLGNLEAAVGDLNSAIGAFQGNIGPNAQPAGVDGFGLGNLYLAQGHVYVELHQPALAIAAYHSALEALPASSVDAISQVLDDIKAAK